MLPEKTADIPIVLQAQHVHTEAYLRAGFITRGELNGSGLYVDDYTERSEPIFVKTSDKETAIRMIHADKESGILSLPTAEKFSVDASIIKDVAHVSRLSDIKPRQVVEISGLSSIKAHEGTTKEEAFDATRQAYATGLRRSLDQGHILWLMNIEPRLNNWLKNVLGKDALSQLGESKQLIGPPTVPYALNPQDVVTSILKGDSPERFSEMNKNDIRATLGGVSEKYLSKELIDLLHENGIETKKATALENALKRKKTIGYAAIIGYSTLRAIPVAAIPEFDGNGFVFAGIDVGTAVVQVLGMEKYLTGKKRVTRALGATVAVASLITPYGYVYLQGEDYPAYVNVIAGTLIAGAAVGEAVKTVKDVKIRDRLATSTLE
jgi:hypothetical protein